MSGGCSYVKAKVVFDIQTGMGGDVEIHNECV